MTTIAVKGLTMAVDSLVTRGDMKCGFTQKWRAVPKAHGGGYVAAGGPLPAVEKFFANFPDDAHEDVRGIHLKDGGEIVLYDDGATIKGLSGLGYYVVGSGSDFAAGAMEVGADAVKAVEAACALDVSTGGKVWELIVNENEVDLE